MTDIGEFALVLAVFSARECSANIPSVVVPTTSATAGLTPIVLLTKPSQLRWVRVWFAVSAIAILLAFSQKLLA